MSTLYSVLYTVCIVYHTNIIVNMWIALAYIINKYILLAIYIYSTYSTASEKKYTINIIKILLEFSV